MSRKRRLAFALGILAVALIAARVYLPVGVRGFVNRALANMEGYSGSVGDVDIALWRGAYRIQNVVIDKNDGGVSAPFVKVEAIDISIEWRALFQGALAGEAVVERPEFTFVATEDESEEQAGQLGTEGNWLETLRELVPFRLNRFEISEGSLSFRGGLDAVVPELTIRPFELVASNISNASDEAEALPSSLRAQGILQDGSLLKWSGRFNLLRDPMDMDMELSCDPIDLPQLNDLLQRYAALDAKKGQLGIFSEWAVLDGTIDGYLKFVARDLEIFDLRQDAGNPISAIWEAIAGFLVFLTENKPRDQFATRVPFSGQVDDLNAGILPAIGSLLRNGFVQALSRDVDETISLGSAAEAKETQ